MVIHIEHEKRKAFFCVTLKELTDSFREGRVMNRQVIPSRVNAIKRLLVENENLQQFYFSPIIAHVENGVLDQGLNGKISIIDGTQRVQAFVDLAVLIEKSIDSMSDNKADMAWDIYYLMENWRIPILLFEGLSITEQHNFSIEMNKKNPHQKFIGKDKQIDLISNYVIKMDEWDKHDEGNFFTTKRMSLTQLKQIVNIFVTGTLIGKVKYARFKPVLYREEYVQLIHYWMKRLNDICMKNPSFKSFCTDFTNIEALAIFVNHKNVNASCTEREVILQERMEQIEKMFEWRRTALCGNKNNEEKIYAYWTD